jgi:hypothetical protein
VTVDRHQEGAYYIHIHGLSFPSLYSNFTPRSFEHRQARRLNLARCPRCSYYARARPGAPDGRNSGQRFELHARIEIEVAPSRLRCSRGGAPAGRSAARLAGKAPGAGRANRAVSVFPDDAHPVNLEQLKKNIGNRVQLEPPAIHLDALGRELPGRNDDWIIESVTDTEVGIRDTQVLGLSTTVGRDYVHHWTSNPSRSTPGGLQYGFLTLVAQMYIQQDKITYRPSSRPGERVEPLLVRIVEQWVDFNYLIDSKIQAKLEASGYRVAWVHASRLPGLELDGWERVVEKDRHGMPTSFHLQTRPENQVFVKKRRE